VKVDTGGVWLPDVEMPLLDADTASEILGGEGWSDEGPLVGFALGEFAVLGGGEPG